MPSKNNRTKQTKKNRKKNHTRKSLKMDRPTVNKSKLVQNFIQMLNTIKLYHWKTRSYAQHKATDELYKQLNENIDRFVEILLGKEQSRIQSMDKQIDLVYIEDTATIVEKIHDYRDFLIGLTQTLHPRNDSDLLNVRDEILGDLNQFLYLLSFDK